MSTKQQQMQQKAEAGALATVGKESFPILYTPPGEVRALIQENLGVDRISRFHLNRIRVPAGGAPTWDMTDLDGTPTAAQEITGIILHHRLVRAYYTEAYETTGGGPPTCASEDSRVGHGDPGGDCLTCPFAQWGSAVDMKTGEERDGQRCGQRRALFLLRPGEFLPDLLAVPSMSLKPVQEYLTKLTSRGIPYWGVVNRLTLKREKNKAGLPVSIVQVARVETLGGEVRDRVAALVDALRPLFVGVDAGTIVGEERQAA